MHEVIMTKNYGNYCVPFFADNAVDADLGDRL